MNSLPLTLRNSGFDLTQVWRDDKWAVYRKSKPEHRHSTFEIVRIRHQHEHVWNDRHFPESESYPSSELWGKYGWTCSSWDEVRNHHTLIVKNIPITSGQK